MKYKLDYKISKQVGLPQEEHFQIPPEISNITIKYDIKPECRFLIFLVLIDPNKNIRFQKQLSYNTESIAITESSFTTTMGGIPGRIYEGDWILKVCLFSEYIEKVLGGEDYRFSIEISDDPIIVSERVGGLLWANEKFEYTGYDYRKLYNAEEKWYKGDFHAHTRLSDGHDTIKEINRKANIMNLDFYSATEHNVMHTGWEETSLLIIPSVEVTTIFGHANIFGMKKRFSKLDKVLSASTKEEMKLSLVECIEEAKKENYIISINHPFLYIWKWLYTEMQLKDIDCIEIINDPTYETDKKAKAKEANEKSIYLADLMVSDGYSVCAIGGSDSHNSIDEFYEGSKEPSIAGDPATYLYMDGLSADNVMNALKKKRAYVCRHCEVKTDMEFGKELKEEENEIEYSIILKDCKDKPIVFYIKNGIKTIVKNMRYDGSRYEIHEIIKLEKKDYNWVRFGAETESGEFIFYGNAMVKGSKKHSFNSFGDVSKYISKSFKNKCYK